MLPEVGAPTRQRTLIDTTRPAGRVQVVDRDDPVEIITHAPGP